MNDVTDSEHRAVKQPFASYLCQWRLRIPAVSACKPQTLRQQRALTYIFAGYYNNGSASKDLEFVIACSLCLCKVLYGRVLSWL